MTDDVAVWIWMIAALGYVLALAGLLTAVRLHIRLSLFMDEMDDRVGSLSTRTRSLERGQEKRAVRNPSPFYYPEDSAAFPVIGRNYDYDPFL